MAFANPGPAADPVSSPQRSVGLPAGSGAPSPATAAGSAELVGVARELAPIAAAWTGLRGRSERSWILLDATDGYEAWAIGWPPGSQIDLHDHGASAGAVAVAVGTLTETIVRTSRRGTVVIGAQRIGVGEHRYFGAGHVHHLGNDSDHDAVSVHVYGPRLGTMRYYELDGRGRLVVVRSEPVTSAASRERLPAP